MYLPEVDGSTMGAEPEVPMRILLAVDGSVSSDRAIQLLTGIPLPPDSLVRVVSVHQPFTDVLAMSWATVGAPGTRAVESDQEVDIRHHHEAIGRAEIALRRPGLRVEGFLLRGVRYTRDGATTDSIVMRSRSGTVRRIEATHAFQKLEEISNLALR